MENNPKSVESSATTKNSLNSERKSISQGFNEMIMEGKNKFMSIVDKLMDAIMKNNDKKNPLKPQNSGGILKNNCSDDAFQKVRDRLKIKSATLIQRKFRDYLKKKYHYDPQVYPTQKEIDAKSKEELKNELIKYINENKKLIEKLNIYKNKINYI